jgi:hypothetical protein
MISSLWKETIQEKYSVVVFPHVKLCDTKFFPDKFCILCRSLRASVIYSVPVNYVRRGINTYSGESVPSEYGSFVEFGVGDLNFIGLLQFT